jgi:uncharacterized membrane protein YagU involved in acid resistance
MSENVLSDSSEIPSSNHPRAFDTIVYGGLVVGILDMLFAFTFYGVILGVKPLRIFQSVASGLLGRTTAYGGGIRTFLLGILLHFIVASCIATVYYVASRMLPVLIRYPIASGLIYGMIAYLGMNYVVVPLSAIGRRSAPLQIRIFLTEIIGHAFLVGLPLALLARRSARANANHRNSTLSRERTGPH